MRTGFIGDIHGELGALQWALDTLRDADRIVALGDVVHGPHDEACIDLLRSPRVVVLQGNHDCWEVRDGASPHVDWLSQLPRRLDSDHFLAIHSRFYETANETIWEYLQSDYEVLRALDECDHQVLVCCHTHIPALYEVQPPADVRCLSSSNLRASPLVQVLPDRRYLVNAGTPLACVVMLSGDEIEFRFNG